MRGPRPRAGAGPTASGRQCLLTTVDGRVQDGFWPGSGQGGPPMRYAVTLVFEVGRGKVPRGADILSRMTVPRRAIHRFSYCDGRTLTVVVDWSARTAAQAVDEAVLTTRLVWAQLTGDDPGDPLSRQVRPLGCGSRGGRTGRPARAGDGRARRGRTASGADRRSEAAARPGRRRRRRTRRRSRAAAAQARAPAPVRRAERASVGAALGSGPVPTELRIRPATVTTGRASGRSSRRSSTRARPTPTPRT